MCNHPPEPPENYVVLKRSETPMQVAQRKADEKAAAKESGKDNAEKK